MSNIHPEAPYYDDYNPKKNYTGILAIPGRALQAREMTQLGSMQRDFVERLGNAVFSNGHIVKGIECIVADNKVTITEGQIFLSGLVREMEQATFDIEAVGTYTIGINIKNSIVTEKEDETLRDPAQSFENYNQAGTHRTKEDPYYTLNDNTSVPLFTIVDGELQTNTTEDDNTFLYDTLARRTYDENGNYKVSGLKMSSRDEAVGDRIFCTLSPGKAYIKGYEVVKTANTSFALNKSKTTIKVTSEPKVYRSAQSSYNLNNAPVSDIEVITANIQVTQQRTRGGIRSGSDALPNTPVREIISVTQGDTVYTQGVDYQLINDTISWGLPQNKQPSPGSTYTITYVYVKKLEENIDYTVSYNDTTRVTTLTFTGSGVTPVEGSQFNINYSFYLARKDTITLDRYGQIGVIEGEPDFISLVKARNNENPDLLTLGFIMVYPNSEHMVIVNKKTERLTQEELYNVSRRVDDLEYNQAVSDLDKEAEAEEEATELKGILTDGFIGYTKADINHPDFDGYIDIGNGQFTLPSTYVMNNVDISTDSADTNCMTIGRVLLAPYQDIQCQAQSLASSLVLVNEYSVFSPMCVLELSPQIDNWVDTEKVTVEGETVTNTNFIYSFNTTYDTEERTTVNNQKITGSANGSISASAVTGISQSSTTTVTDTVSSSNTIYTTAYQFLGSSLVEYMRQREVTLEGHNYLANLDNIKCRFNDTEVALTPIGDFQGSTPGTVKADSKGYVKCKFTIPENVPCGTVRVVLYNGAFKGYNDYTATGTKNLIQETVTASVTNNVEREVSTNVLTVINKEDINVDIVKLESCVSPSFSPTPGKFTTTKQVALATTTQGAQIWYTTDGTYPVKDSSRLYAGPITVTETTLIRAIATKDGMDNSEVSDGIFEIELIQPACAAPVSSLASGDYYTSAVTVTLSCPTAGATIYYTTDGSTPTVGSSIYKSGLRFSVDTILKAFATAPGCTASSEVTWVYNLEQMSQDLCATPTPTVAAGSYESAQTVGLITSTQGADIYYTVNGSMPTTSSTKYTNAISLTTSATIKAIAVKSGMQNSLVGSYAYKIGKVLEPAPQQVNTPTSSIQSGIYEGSITTTLYCATPGATIYYTTNGSTPTTNSTRYTGAITLGSSCILKILAVKTGMVNSNINQYSYTFTVKPKCNPVTITTDNAAVKSASFVGSCSVKMTTTTPGATIKYSVNNGVWQTYTTAFTVSADCTIKAYATRSGYTDSDVNSINLSKRVVQRPNPPVWNYRNQSISRPNNVGLLPPIPLKATSSSLTGNQQIMWRQGIIRELPEDGSGLYLWKSGNFGQREVTVGNIDQGATGYYTAIVWDNSQRTCSEASYTTNSYFTYTVSRGGNGTDPVAQSFNFEDNTILTKAHLYFGTKDETRGIVVQIRNMVNGYPGPLIYASVPVDADDVNVSSDASLATEVRFNQPVYCKAEEDYCIVVLADVNTYSMHKATLGEIDITSGEKIVSNPSSGGVLFTSSNNKTWTADQLSDLKYELYQAKFTGNGIITFKNVSLAQVTRLILSAETVDYNNNGITWYYRTKDTDNWTSLSLFKQEEMDDSVTHVSLKAELVASFSTSPIIAAETVSLLSFIEKPKATYISRNVTLSEPFTKLRVNLQAALPAGCDMKIYYCYNGDGYKDEDWNLIGVEPTLKEISDEWTEYNFLVENIPDGENYRIKVVLETPSVFSRPKIRKLKSILKY